MKKIFALVLSLALIIGLCPMISASQIVSIKPIESATTSLDTIDILLVASAFLNAPDLQEDILTSSSTVDICHPLYNPSGQIVAYYVVFNPAGYAVVNNNINNPTVIEFGAGGNPLIDNILATNTSSRIIYNNPTEVFIEDEAISLAILKSNISNCDLYTYYPELGEVDLESTAQLDYIKQQFANVATPYGDGDYGFINWGDMPSGSYDWDIITNCTSTDWATTSEFTSIASNHCAATAVTNLALYFANRGYSNLKINNSVMDTFKSVHAIVGNGPVMVIAGDTAQYFSNRGYTLNYSSISNFLGIIIAVANDRPSGVLLANALFDWHWVIAVGYRDYDAGGSYMRIVDGWYDTTLRFYKCNTGSTWWSTTQYWISP